MKSKRKIRGKKGESKGRKFGRAGEVKGDEDRAVRRERKVGGDGGKRGGEQDRKRRKVRRRTRGERRRKKGKDKGR